MTSSTHLSWGRTLVVAGSALGLAVAGTVLAQPAAAEPVPGAEVWIGDTSLTADAGCTAATVPAEGAWCWDGGTELVLRAVDITNIRAIGVDLTIHLIGDSRIAALGVDGIWVFDGDLTFDGTGTVQIGTADQTTTAIAMAPVATPGHLTVGVDASRTVTVRIVAGSSVPSADVTVGAGSTYDYVTPGPGPGDPGPGDPGPGDPGPPPGIPGTLTVGGVVLVDDGVRTANTVPGVTVDYMVIPPMVEFWTLTFEGSDDPAAPTPYGPVEVTGSQSFFVGANGYASFGANAEGLSFDGGDDHGGFAFMGPDTGAAALFLDGGLRSDDVALDGAIHVRVGSEGDPSPVGVIANRGVNTYNPGATGDALLEVYTDPGVVGITGADPHAQVSAQSSGVIRVVAGGAAFSGLTAQQVRVSNGGELDVTFGTGLGVTHGVSVVWPMQEVGCIDVEAPMVEPTLVPADLAGDFGDDPARRYVLESGPVTYHLTSTAPGLVNFSWEEGSNAMNPVTGGEVCVLASRGWAQVDQGVYFSFMIEEGSDVTVLLLPEHEHQFAAGEFDYLGPDEIGGGAVPVDPIVSRAAEYTFTMPEENITLSAVFDGVPDPAADVTDTDVITGAQVDVAPDVIHGNAQIAIDDLGTPDNASEFLAAADGRTVASYVEISVEQQIQQGDTAGLWVEDLTTLSAPATVTLELDDALLGFTDYVVIHDDGESVTTVPATYDEVSGTLSFETDGFSPFAIAHGPAAAPTLPATGVDAGQVSGLVATAVLLVLVGTGLVGLRERRRPAVG